MDKRPKKLCLQKKKNKPRTRGQGLRKPFLSAEEVMRQRGKAEWEPGVTFDDMTAVIKKSMTGGGRWERRLDARTRAMTKKDGAIREDGTDGRRVRVSVRYWPCCKTAWSRRKCCIVKMGGKKKRRTRRQRGEEKSWVGLASSVVIQRRERRETEEVAHRHLERHI